MNLFSLGAPSWFWEAINSLWLIICQVIFVCINWFYQVFEKVASVNLFSTEVFKEITSRIYVIMGIAMLFIFAYNLVLMIINPEDKKGSGAMGKVIKETMISLVVVVLLPTIFNYMYIFQSHILETNIIGQIIMGSVGNTTSDRTNCKADDYDCLCNFDKFEELNNYSGYHNGWILKYETNTQADEVAKIKLACETYRDYNDSKVTDSQRGAFSIAPTIFSAFYRPTNFTMEDCENYLINNDISKINNDKDQKICINYFYDVHMSKYTGDIMPFIKDSYLSAIISDSTDDSMDFNWFLAIIGGGLAAWMFICYAMEIGVRVAKLGLLQIISPIAVMMRVIPGQKEKIFDKWFSHLKNTYLDVFIRLVIIYFSLFAISLVEDVLDTLWISTVTQEAASSNAFSGFFIKTLAMVVVILGILKFAQEAPALIKEFFGDSGRFALKSPKKQLQDNKLAKGAAGFAIGGFSNAVGNYRKGGGLKSTLGGFFGGARRGAIKGYKSNGNFIGDMKQAKFETDKARVERENRKKYSAEHYGYSGFGAGIAGGIGKSLSNFNDYLSEDGSLKVQSNAAQNAFSAFEKFEGGFKNVKISNFEAEASKIRGELQVPSPDTSKIFGKTTVKYDKNGMWNVSAPEVDSTGKETGRIVNTREDGDAVLARWDKYVGEEKRKMFAENYSKNDFGMAEGIKMAMAELTKNIPSMGNDFATNLISQINKKGIKLNDDTSIKLDGNSIESVEDMFKNLQDKKEYGAIYELSDTIKGELKSKKIGFGFADTIKESKKSDK